MGLERNTMGSLALAEPVQQIAGNGHLSNPATALHHTKFEPPRTVPEATGLLDDTRILTPEGHRAIAMLDQGDTVILQDGQEATIRHILDAPRSTHCVEISAPYLELDQDLIIGREHQIAITCLSAEYLFDVDTVLVPAWVFCNTVKARNCELGPSARMVQVQLDRPGAVCVGGCEIASLSAPEQTHLRSLTKIEAQAFAMEYNQGVFI